MKFTPNPKSKKKKKKKRPGADPKYIAWIKNQPCCVPGCNNYCGQVVPAHMRILGRGGTGIKPPDRDALPMGKLHHDKSHKIGDISFWLQGNKANTKEFIQELCDKHIFKYLRRKP